ncbi:MAG TPA: hypothetical protein EYP54_09260, partial [Anaerolineales bacterium]|nr:hypothetical protein [Anaerolineales bacterium]
MVLVDGRVAGGCAGARRLRQGHAHGGPAGGEDRGSRCRASDDLDLVVTAILVQREVGGNLAEVL